MILEKQNQGQCFADTCKWLIMVIERMEKPANLLEKNARKEISFQTADTTWGPKLALPMDFRRLQTTLHLQAI